MQGLDAVIIDGAFKHPASQHSASVAGLAPQAAEAPRTAPSSATQARSAQAPVNPRAGPASTGARPMQGVHGADLPINNSSDTDWEVLAASSATLIAASDGGTLFASSTVASMEAHHSPGAVGTVAPHVQAASAAMLLQQLEAERVEGELTAAVAAAAPAQPQAAAKAAPAVSAPAPAAGLTPEQERQAAEAADQFFQLYDQAYLTRACYALDAFLAASGLPASAVAAALSAAHAGVDLDELRARGACARARAAAAASDDGWTLVRDAGGLRLLYRHDPGSSVHCFKGACLLPAPLEQPLSMAREFDLVTSWNTYTLDTTVLKPYALVDVLVYGAVWLPWPFEARDFAIRAVGLDMLHDAVEGGGGAVFIDFSSPAEAQLPPDCPLPDGAAKRVHISFLPGSCLKMTPRRPDADGGPQQTDVTLVANIETHLAHVPEAVIYFVLKVFAPYVHKVVLQVLARSFGGQDMPLPRRIAQRPELYAAIRQRVADFLAGGATC